MTKWSSSAYISLSHYTGNPNSNPLKHNGNYTYHLF